MATRQLDAARPHESLGEDHLTRTDRANLFRYMLLMRVSEERALTLYRQGKVPGSFYDGRGQEAVSVGSAFVLGPRDRMCILHRDLGAHLVRGVTPDRYLANYMGRRDGVTGGRDGNMHFGDRRLGCVGMVSMLPDMAPVATASRDRRHVGGRRDHAKAPSRAAGRRSSCSPSQPPVSPSGAPCSSRGTGPALPRRRGARRGRGAVCHPVARPKPVGQADRTGSSPPPVVGRGRDLSLPVERERALPGFFCQHVAKEVRMIRCTYKEGSPSDSCSSGRVELAVVNSFSPSSRAPAGVRENRFEAAPGSPAPPLRTIGGAFDPPSDLFLFLSRVTTSGGGTPNEPPGGAEHCYSAIESGCSSSWGCGEELGGICAVEDAVVADEFHAHHVARRPRATSFVHRPSS